MNERSWMDEVLYYCSTIQPIERLPVAVQAFWVQETSQQCESGRILLILIGKHCSLHPPDCHGMTIEISFLQLSVSCCPLLNLFNPTISWTTIVQYTYCRERCLMKQPSHPMLLHYQYRITRVRRTRKQETRRISSRFGDRSAVWIHRIGIKHHQISRSLVSTVMHCRSQPHKLSGYLAYTVIVVDCVSWV